MSNMSNLDLDRKEQDDDVENCARWNAYCSLKEVLSQEMYMRHYGNGDFESFNEAIDGMNRDEY